MKHSDVQENFTTGAKRDTQSGKLRYDLISPLALTRLAVIYTKGAEHYGDRNWEKGMPFSRVMASLQRHLFAFLMGDISEDHLAQMVWNGMTIMHYQEMQARDLLPAELNDLPSYASAVRSVEPQKFFDHPQREQDYRKLVALGCPSETARQVVGGITYCPEAMSKQYVYIAGPMRGLPQFNFPAFDAVRDAFLAKGYNIISPADIDRYANPNADDTIQDVSDQTVFVLRDFFANYYLKKIDTGRNGIVLLPNWLKSTGGTGELFLDKWLGLKAYRPDGTEYPMDDARHDFALFYAASPGLLKEKPAAVSSSPSLDGDYDVAPGIASGVPRGQGHFFRVRGDRLLTVRYQDGREGNMTTDLDYVREQIAQGRWTRI